MKLHDFKEVQKLVIARAELQRNRAQLSESMEKNQTVSIRSEGADPWSVTVSCGPRSLQARQLALEFFESEELEIDRALSSYGVDV